MKYSITSSLLVFLMLLSGCATHTALSPYRFAPPKINRALSSDRTIFAARDVVRTYIEKYSAAHSENGDARQVFEVPALVAAIGGVAATAFGGGSDGILAAGTATALFKSGNAYYAPRSKAAMYDDALDGLLCIGQVAAGSKPYDAKFAMMNIGRAATSDESDVYDVLTNGVYSIERILTARLANAGSLTDAAGIAAEYEKSVKAELEARAKAEKAKGDSQKFTLATREGIEAQQANALAKLEILQEAVQQCVLHAKV